MTIDSFAEYLITHAKTKLSSDYCNAEFTVIHRIKPGNLPATSINIRKHSQDISPCFYIDGLYEQYSEGMNLPALADSFAKYVMEYELIPDFQKEWITDFDKAKDYIVSRLIDIRPTHNDGYLEGRPVKRLGNTDIGIIYELDVSQFVGAGYSIPVTDTLVEAWNISSLDEIYMYTEKNTPKLRPPALYSLSDIYRRYMDTDESDSPAKYMFVLTNTSKYYGANVILYPEVQKALDRFPTGYYILPSSVHETIVVPKCFVHPQQLLEMVTHINKTQVSIDERLADDVFVIKDGTLVSAV